MECPHCGKEVKISLPPLEDFRMKLIDAKWGGVSVPELRKWLEDNLIIEKKD